MKRKELEKLSKEELGIKLSDNNEALLNLRIQKALQQLEHPQKISHIKKDIARVKTLIRQQELGIGSK